MCGEGDILNAVDEEEHVLNKRNYTNNNQTELGYFTNKDLLYILLSVYRPQYTLQKLTQIEVCRRSKKPDISLMSG